MSNYSVGITLSLIDGVSSALTAIGGRMAVLNNQATTLNSSLMMIGKGAVIASVGFKGIEMGMDFLKEPLHSAISYEKQIAILRQQGLGDHQISEARKFADSQQIIGQSRMDMIRHFTEAQGAFRESGLGGDEALYAAKIMTPVLAKYETATAMLGEKSQAAAHQSMQNLNKTVEIMGGINDPKKAAEIADGIFKAVQSSGRMIDERQLKQFVAYGSSATNSMDMRAIFGGLEPIIGEFGGSTVGTGLRTAFTRMSGAMSLPPKKMQRILEELGIGQKDHGSVRLKDDLLSLMQKDAIGFASKMMTIYSAHGITETLDMERANAQLFGTNGAKIYNKLMNQMPVLEHSMQAYDKSLGASQMLDTPEGRRLTQLQDYPKKIEDLNLALGQSGGVLDLVINALTIINPMLHSLSEFMLNHSTIVQMLIAGFFALTGAMAIGGTVMMLVGAFRLLNVAMGAGQLTSFFPVLSGGLSALAVGIRAAGMALLTTPIGWALMGIAGAAYLIYRNWSTVQPELEKLWNKTSPAIIGATKFQYAVILQYFENLKNAAVMLWNGSKNIIPAIASAWAMGKTVIGAIVNATVSYITARWQQSTVISPIVSGIVSFIVARWQQSNVIRPIVNGVVSFITQKWQAGGELIKGVVSSVVNYIISAFQSIGGAISGMIGSVNAWSNKVISTSGIANTVSNALGIGGKQLDVVAGGKAKATVVHTQVNMDGHKVAKVVTHHQSKSANKPKHGVSRHDGNMSPRYVGAH